LLRVTAAITPPMMSSKNNPSAAKMTGFLDDGSWGLTGTPAGGAPNGVGAAAGAGCTGGTAARGATGGGD